MKPLFMLLLALSLPLHAATIAVAPGGSIQAAVDRAVAGDTVQVAAGVYKGQVNLNKSGTAAAPILYKGGPGVVIDGSGVNLGQWGALVYLTGNYIRFEGFEVRNASVRSIFANGHHQEIVGNDVHNGGSSGIWIERSATTPAFSKIVGNKVHDNAQGGITLYIYTGGYYLVEGNEAYSNRGDGNFDGIQIGSGDGAGHHVVVRNNFAHDNGAGIEGAGNLDLGGHALAHHYLVEGNRTANGQGFKLHTGDRSGKGATGAYYVDGVSGFAIVRFNAFRESFTSYEYPNPLAVYNNTFYNCGQCIFFYGEDSSKLQSFGDRTYTGGDAGRMTWKNNIVTSGSGSYMQIWGAPSGGTLDFSYKSVRLYNNFYRYGAGTKIGWGNMTVTGDKSGWDQYTSSGGADKPDVGSTFSTATDAQLFVNAGAADFHLAAGSPAVDKGVPLTKATNAGTNSTLLGVDRASFFFDGYCINGECLGVADSIMIGTAGPYKIQSIDDARNVISLSAPATWVVGAAVTLPYSGNAPDMGAFESGATAPALPPDPVPCSYVYSNWGVCSTGIQARQVLNAAPLACVGTPVLAQSCTVVVPSPVPATCSCPAGWKCT